MAHGAMLVLAAQTSIQQKNKTNLLEDGVLESIEFTCACRTIMRRVVCADISLLFEEITIHAMGLHSTSNNIHM
jgi:hypothetical protein